MPSLLQTRFALSSSKMNQKVGGAFNSTDFFWHAVEYLEDPFFEDEVKELLDWWNRYVGRVLN